MLTTPSHHSAATTRSGSDTAAASTEPPRKKPPRPRLVAGPAIAILNSSPGDDISASSSDTPPNIHRVMPRTVTPNLRASSECASSWVTNEAKKSSAATAATPA